MDKNETISNNGKSGNESTSLKEFRRLLSPCDISTDDMSSHIAVDDLRFALEHPDSRNIAITGNYGSGKSSVVKTCIDEMGIEKDVLRISMSTFSIDKGDKHPEVEYKIVQHLLYKCDKTKIPYSRFQQLHHIEENKLKKYISWGLIAVVCFIIAFEPKFIRIESIYQLYDWFFGLFGKNVGKVINIIADILSLGYLMWFAYKIGIYLARKINRLRNIKVEAKGVTLEASVEVSVFNKYLEEILYIIQANHYKYILFEDLDRIDDSDRLFLKIRELNMLINESVAFKRENRVIRFIYAIRDDIFSRELRTKCFDYIVAVVPVVDHYNVSDYLIKEYKSKGLFKTVDNTVLEQLLSKVSGLRELKNIVNEYSLFEKSLKTHLSDDVENYEQRLLAVIVYKNLYPQDFAMVYQKHGLLYQAFQKKQSFYEGFTKPLEEKAKAAKQNMDEARKNIVSIRKQYLLALNNGFSVTKFIKDGYDYTLDQVANRDNLFDLFTEDAFDRYTYIEDDGETVGESGYDFSFTDLEKDVSEDMGYFEAVNENQNKYIDNFEESVKLEKEIKVFENTALRELIRELGPDSAKNILKGICDVEYPIIKDEPRIEYTNMTDTLYSMLYGGYISEDYYLYISKFYEGATSENDYQFINAILQGAERPYDQKLDSPKRVLGKLEVDVFKNKNILNYDIVNYLLDGQQEHFLSTFIDTARKNPDFIVNYYLMAEPVNNKFFTKIFYGWDSCINIIRGQEKAENGEILLKLFLRESPSGIKLTDEEINYLNGKYEFININIQMIVIKRLEHLINTFNLHFDNLVVPNSNSIELYKYCLRNKHFTINKNNMMVILGENFSKKPMTAILGIDEIRLKNYLTKNQNTIVQYFDSECNEESRDAILYMIKENVADEEWLIEYIRKQKYVFEKIDDLDSHAIDLILNADKMSVSWALILDIININGELTESLNNFIKLHTESLSQSKCAGLDNLINILHTELFNDTNQAFEEYTRLLNSFDQNFTLKEIKGLSDDKLAEIIRQRKIEGNPEIFEYLNQNSEEFVVDDYLKLHFDVLLDEEGIDWNECIRNSMGVHILESNLTLAQKKRFMDERLIIQDGSDAEKLSHLVCFYYFEGGVQDADDELIIQALNTYQSSGSWELKIKLINKCNATWEYDTERENKLLKSLGGEYIRLTYPRGWANFDVNQYNEELLFFLQDSGHYINNIDVKDGQYYVTFKHS